MGELALNLAFHRGQFISTCFCFKYRSEYVSLTKEILYQHTDGWLTSQFKVSGLKIGGGGKIDQSEFFSCLPPKSFVMVHYKTSHLKVLEFLRRKKPPTNRPNYFFDFPIIGPKKNCRKLYIWVSNPIRRKIQEQWKKELAQSNILV